MITKGTCSHCGKRFTASSWGIAYPTMDGKQRMNLCTAGGPKSCSAKVQGYWDRAKALGIA